MDTNQNNRNDLNKTLSDLIKEKEVTSENDLIEALEVKLKMIQDLYKKSLDEQHDIRTKYSITAQSLAAHKLIDNKLNEEKERFQRIPKDREAFLKEQNKLKSKATKWKEKYDLLATRLEHKESSKDQRKLDKLFEMFRNLETQLFERTEQFATFLDAIDAQIPKDGKTSFATIRLKAIRMPSKSNMYKSQQEADEDPSNDDFTNDDVTNDESDGEDTAAFTVDVAKLRRIRRDSEHLRSELAELSSSIQIIIGQDSGEKVALKVSEEEDEEEPLPMVDTDLLRISSRKVGVERSNSIVPSDTALEQLYPKDESQKDLTLKTHMIAKPEQIFRSGKLGPVSSSQKPKTSGNSPDKSKVPPKDTKTDGHGIDQTNALKVGPPDTFKIPKPVTIAGRQPSLDKFEQKLPRQRSVVTMNVTDQGLKEASKDTRTDGHGVEETNALKVDPPDTFKLPKSQTIAAKQPTLDKLPRQRSVVTMNVTDQGLKVASKDTRTDGHGIEETNASKVGPPDTIKLPKPPTIAAKQPTLDKLEHKLPRQRSVVTMNVTDQGSKAASKDTRALKADLPDTIKLPKTPTIAGKQPSLDKFEHQLPLERSFAKLNVTVKASDSLTESYSTSKPNSGTESDLDVTAVATLISWDDSWKPLDLGLSKEDSQLPEPGTSWLGYLLGEAPSKKSNETDGKGKANKAKSKTDIDKDDPGLVKTASLGLLDVSRSPKPAQKMNTSVAAPLGDSLTKSASSIHVKSENLSQSIYSISDTSYLSCNDSWSVVYRDLPHWESDNKKLPSSLSEDSRSLKSTQEFEDSKDAPWERISEIYSISDSSGSWRDLDPKWPPWNPNKKGLLDLLPEAGQSPKSIQVIDISDDVRLGESNKIMSDAEGEVDKVKPKTVLDRDAGAQVDHKLSKPISKTEAPLVKSDIPTRTPEVTSGRGVTPIPRALNPLETSSPLPKKLENLNDQMKDKSKIATIQDSKQAFVDAHDTKGPSFIALKSDATGKRPSKKFYRPIPSKSPVLPYTRRSSKPTIQDRRSPPPEVLNTTLAGLKQVRDLQKQEIGELKEKLEEKSKQLDFMLKEDQKHANRCLGLLRHYEDDVDEINDKCNVALEKLEAAEQNRGALEKRLKELQNIPGEEKHLLTEARGSSKEDSETEMLKPSKTDEDNAMALGILAAKNRYLKKKSRERDLPIQNQQNEIDDLERQLRKKPDSTKSYEHYSTKGTCVCDELERRLRPNEENSEKEKNDEKELKALIDSNKKLQDQLDLDAQRQQKLRNDIKAKRSKYEDENERLIAEIADAMKRLESNRNEFTAQQEKIQRDLDALRLDNERLKAELQHVKAHLNAKEAKAKELQEDKLDNAELRNKLRISTEALKGLREGLNETDNLRVENPKLKNKMDTVHLTEDEHKIDELKAANEDLRNQIRALEEKLEGATPDDSFMHFIAPEQMTRYFSTKAAPLTFSDELFNSYKNYSWENRQSDILTKSYDKDRYLSGRVSPLSVLEDDSTSDRDNRPSVDKRSTKPQVRIKETSARSSIPPLSNQFPKDEKEPVKISSEVELLYGNSLPKDNKDEPMMLPVKNMNPRAGKATTCTRHSNGIKRSCLGTPRQIPQNLSLKYFKVPTSRTPVPANKPQKNLKSSSRTCAKCPHGHKIYY